MMTGPTRTTHAAILGGLVRLAMVLVVFGGLSAAGFAQPEVTIAGGNAAEAGEVLGTFTVSRTPPNNGDLVVNFMVGGTAIDPDDYSLSHPGSVTIFDGDPSATVTVTPEDDPVIGEGDETVILTLDAGLYTIGGSGEATVTIADDDLPVVSITATDAEAAEAGVDPGAFTVSRTGVNGGDLVVNFTVDGTATDPDDYSLSHPGSVTILDGAPSAAVAVTPVDDLVIGEGDETVILTLDDGAYTIGVPDTAAVTIADNDLPSVSIVATDPDADEEMVDTGTFTVFRTGPTALPLLVNVSVSGTAADPADYSLAGAPLGIVTIPFGSDSANVTVTPVDDALIEGDETVIVTIEPSVLLYTIDGGNSTATVTIADNDFPPPVPQVSIVATDPNASEEGPDPATFTISRKDATTGDLMVAFTVAGSATDPDDYTIAGASSPGVVTIPDGSAFATLTINPVDDAVQGESGETVIITLQPSAAYTIDAANSSGIVSIADNDILLAEVSILATTPDANEEGETGEFTISRSGLTGTAMLVRFAVSGTASAPDDYALVGASGPGEITIPAGSSTAVLTVQPVDDAINEGNETVAVTLQADAAYRIDAGRSTALVNIADNDATISTVTVRASDPTASETGATGEFTFERQGDTADALTVSYSVGGSATPGADYAALAGTVMFGPGITGVTVTVTPVGDSEDEGEETVDVTITPGAGYTIGSPASATVTIREQGGDFTISGPGSGTGTDPLFLSLTLDSPATEPINGGWRFVFTPDPSVPGNRQVDEQIALSTPSFSIPMGATEASPPLTVNLGTVAGTITVIAEINGVTVAEHPITFAPGPPRVTGGEIVTQANGFDIVVFGFSSRLDVASATFVFTGPNVQQPGLVNVDAAFTAWFENPASADDGTMFEYKQPFTVDGNRSALTSVRVTLVGSDGVQSDPITIPIP